jgi:hypothetical protein
LVPHEPHRAPNKCGQQIANIKRIDNRRQRTRRGTVFLVWCGRESNKDEDGKYRHFACEYEFGERGVDVVVSHVFGGFEDVLACEDGDYELLDILAMDQLSRCERDLQFGKRSAR